MGWLDLLLKRKSTENADLEKIMLEMSRNPEIKVRRVLYRELLRSTLLLPTPSLLEVPPEGRPLKEIQLVTQSGPKGELVWIAFTSKQALQRWRSQEGSPYVAIQGSQAFILAVQNRVESILINPAGPIGGKIMAMELEMLAEGTFPAETGGRTHAVQAREQTSIQIGTPAQKPNPQLLEYLREGLSRNSDVMAGYVVAMIIGGGAPHLVLGIQFAAVPKREIVKPIMDAIGGGIHPFLSRDEFLDMVPFDARHEWFGPIQKFGIVVYQKA